MLRRGDSALNAGWGLGRGSEKRPHLVFVIIQMAGSGVVRSRYNEVMMAFTVASESGQCDDSSPWVLAQMLQMCHPLRTAVLNRNVCS